MEGVYGELPPCAVLLRSPGCCSRCQRPFDHEEISAIIGYKRLGPQGLMAIDVCAGCHHGEEILAWSRHLIRTPLN